MPVSEYIGVTGASDHDGKLFDQIRPQLHNSELYGDKAYQRPDAGEVRQAQNLTVLTPVKKQKGQSCLEPQDQWLSTAVSRVWQPMKHYLSGLKKKQALNVPAKCVFIKGL